MSIPRISPARLQKLSSNFKMTPGKFSNFISNYRKADVILPMILLETAVTTGRAVNANKRDGFTEMRERLSEDIFAAIFWLFSASIFNKIGDFIGEKFLRLPIKEFDVGKDALRTPFDNLHDDIVHKKLPEAAKKIIGDRDISKKALAGFKFGKIIASTAAAVGLIGFIFPKVNQAITKKLYHKNNANEKTAGNSSITEEFKDFSIDDFKKQLNVQSNEKSAPAFKGAYDWVEFMAKTAHGLEHHTTYKLLATDVGIVSGRASNARNKDERIEILFRDPASSFFYYFATPLSFMAMQKLPFAKMTKLDPNSAMHTHNWMLQNKELVQNLDNGMDADAFRKAVLGETDNLDKILEKIPFKNDVIRFSELEKSGSLNKKLLKVAEKMSELQPKQMVNGEEIAVLTKRQVQDVLSGGVLNDPAILKDVYLNKFGKKLTNPYKFISMKDINGFRGNIDDYINTIVDYAKKNENGKINLEFLTKMCKKNLRKTSIFTGVSFAVSALFLSTIIPKTQYLITKLRTGEDKFPGAKELEKNT